MESQPSPHLKRVLRTYQLSAASTMSGPSLVMARIESNGNGSGNNGNGTLSRSRNGSLDGRNSHDTALLREFPFSTSFRKSLNGESLFNRSTSFNFGTRNHPNSFSKEKSNGVYGIKTKSDTVGRGTSINVPRKHRNSIGGGNSYEIRDNNGGSLIINSMEKTHHKSGTTHPPPPPILSTPDRTKAEKRETILEGEIIACFSVGGEKRLCLLQTLQILQKNGFQLSEINPVCDELQIYCSVCSNEQLEILKKTRVIPASAVSCGLITRTDAERLVSALIHRNPPKAAMSVLSAVNRPQDPNKPQPNSHFRICHYCFGKAKGVVLPHLYEKPDSLCIECIDCHGLFSPQRFVCHSHQPLENRTCHWGFDSTKWRHYIMVAKDQDNREKLEKALDDFKARFDRKRREPSESMDEMNRNAVEMVGPEGGTDGEHVVIKRTRYSTDSSSIGSSPSSPPSYLSSPTILPNKKKWLQLSSSDSNQMIMEPPQQHLHHHFSNGLLTGSTLELESIKNLVIGSMEREGADLVTSYLDKLVGEISKLEQICVNQERVLTEFKAKKSSAPPRIGFQLKVNTVESEIQSMKRNILKRHGEEVK